MRLGNLPEANFLQKTDVIYGAGTGIAVGGFLGVIGGVLVVLFPPAGATLPMGAVLITGAWRGVRRLDREHGGYGGPQFQARCVSTASRRGKNSDDGGCAVYANS
jgi:hypothetical protein